MNGSYFQTLAKYNAWANTKLYDALADLTDEDRKASRPSAFGSIHGTLNHILVGDQGWISRLEKKGHSIKSLDEILHADFEPLSNARRAFDAHIIEVVETLDETTLAGNCDYINFAGEQLSTPVTIVLGHLFNHQTHHRGQIHVMMSQTQVAPPSLDIIYYQREQS